MLVKISRRLIGIACLLTLLCATAEAQGRRKFSLADDIEMSKIAGQGGSYDLVTFSPDGRYFAVVTERGLLDRDLVEDSIWTWKTGEIRKFVHETEEPLPPPPTRLVQMATFKKGPIILGLRWLDDSSGVIFLGIANNGNAQIFEADVSTKALRALTPDDQDVTSFDLRNGNLAYTVKSPEPLLAAQRKSKGPAFLTGKNLIDQLFPLDRYPERARDESNYCDLWAVIEDRRFRVENTQTHEPVHLYQWGAWYDREGTFALSPDGRALAVYNAVATVPTEWSQYEERPGLPAHAITLGTQDLHSLNDVKYVRGYVLIDLTNGSFQPLVNAPDGTSRDWYDVRRPRWSPDGRVVLLPSTFLPLDNTYEKERQKLRVRPCASVVYLSTHKVECVLPRLAEGEKGYEDIVDERFDSSDRNKIIFDIAFGEIKENKKSVVFRRSRNGTWERIDSEGSVPSAVNVAIDVNEKQGLNEPPVLIAKDRDTSAARVFWDPNPQLKDINLGDVSVLHWKDHTGHEWEAGLFKPPDFVLGKRYPLVIQTHGFWKALFTTYGSLPTAFAARELAAAGIMVLQMPDDLDDVVDTPREATRHVVGFESAVEKLAADGLIDPRKVGIVGFSRTCYYVMQALTASKSHFAAASITDGVTFSYWQYVGFVDYGGQQDEVNSVMGGPPIGAGLKLWMDRSPDYNLDKVDTPLLIGGQGSVGIFGQWGEYAGLRSLKKPVELLDLGDDDYEHVLTNPGKRLASQGSTVDWFRFWLKGEEDADPEKAEQYARWREFRKLQEQNQKKPSPSVK
jgi:hypothetical protein